MPRQKKRTRAEARRLFRQRVRAALKRADEALRGKYRDEIAALSGLSQAEIDAISPGITDVVTYQLLMEVVKEASRLNLAQAELKARIEEMGEVAVAIARKVPGLADILG